MKENLKKKIPVKYVLKMDLLGFVLQFFCTPAIYTYQIKLIKLGCDGFCSLTYIKKHLPSHFSTKKKINFNTSKLTTNISSYDLESMRLITL